MLALCTGMRPVVMIDYGGKLPELQTRLLSLLELLQEVLSSSNTLVLEYMLILFLIVSSRLYQFSNL